MNQFKLVLEFYKVATPLILAEQQDRWAQDPSAFAELFRMTPIESAVWERIREARAVFYPQYPVDRFFADFANPVAQVAIECDGIEFRLDKASDAQRDARLQELGWTVYRIPGPLCISEYNMLDEPGEDEAQDPFTLRLIRAIAARHGLIRGNAPPDQLDEEMQACMRYSAQGKLGVLGIRP
jgi:very-short-patch-repair endonuclease